MPTDPTRVETEPIYDYPGDTPDAEIFEVLDEPGEPTVPVTVDLPVADVERIHLEMDPQRDPTTCSWIRDAVAGRLVFLDEEWSVPELVNAHRTEYPRDTPEATITARRDEADRDDVTPVTVELPAAWIERIDHERGDDVPIAEWIRRALYTTFETYDNELDLVAEARVDVPREIFERARLEYDHHRALGDGRPLDDVLCDYLLYEFRWTVDGEPVDDVLDE